MITYSTTEAFESSLFEGVDTFIRYIANEIWGEQWITKSVDQRKIEIREARTKLAQLQICKIREIYDYTCEFSYWYYKAFNSIVNTKILENTYYEKLSRK